MFSGQLVASPGLEGEIDKTVYSRGTSNATALVTRNAIRLYDTLERLLKEMPEGQLIKDVPPAVLLKTLIVHSASWGDAGDILKSVFKEWGVYSKKIREYIARFLGYGKVNFDRIYSCTDSRVTAIGGGFIGKDERHIYEFPLPPSLSGKAEWRKLIVTLGWFTPINPAHRKWRCAALYFELEKQEKKYPLYTSRWEADYNAVRRGTIQHEIFFEEKRPVTIEDDSNIIIHVICREETGELMEEVPYALAVTLEVAPKINIYDEVAIKLRQTIRITLANQ